MKITDETKTFEVKHIFGTATLDVSSNVDGTHEQPSVFLHVKNPIIGESAAYGTDDTEQIKEIIEHMAKMAGLEVEITKPFVPQFQPGDRVRSLNDTSYGELGTVLSDTEHYANWNVRVRYDRDTDGGGLLGLFKYEELERVDSGSLDVRNTVHTMGRDGKSTNGLDVSGE